MDFENNIHQNMSSCMLCGRNCGANRNDGLACRKLQKRRTDER